jgi:hypothetical protein
MDIVSFISLRRYTRGVAEMWRPYGEFCEDYGCVASGRSPGKRANFHVASRMGRWIRWVVLNASAEEPEERQDDLS